VSEPERPPKRGQAHDPTGKVHEAGTPIDRWVGEGEAFDAWPCLVCDGRGLMPLAEREQHQPPLPRGTECSACNGHGVAGGKEL
jgi:hypothetical protein